MSEILFFNLSIEAEAFSWHLKHSNKISWDRCDLKALGKNLL